jgi:predicted dithiol-disulfide oxidoreductase (DUF899 family)
MENLDFNEEELKEKIEEIAHERGLLPSLKHRQDKIFDQKKTKLLRNVLFGKGK